MDEGVRAGVGWGQTLAVEVEEEAKGIYPAVRLKLVVIPTYDCVGGAAAGMYDLDGIEYT
jgi:hypothetical protein